MNFSTIFDLCFLLKFFKRGHDYPVTGRGHDYPKYGSRVKFGTNFQGKSSMAMLVGEDVFMSVE